MGGQELRFGRFTLDTDQKLLTEGGKPLAVGARAIALLEALVLAGGKTLSKTELMDLAWPGQSVEESNLSVQIAGLRKLLGMRDDGEDWIATVARVGYRFMPENSSQPTAPSPNGQSDTATIAVLPFTNLSSDSEKEFFADGMTEDIIMALSRIGQLFVISRGSSFALKGQRIGASEAAEKLGVRYILEGSIRPSGGRIRVAAQLTDCRSNSTIWAERFDSAEEDVFAVQDSMTQAIVHALQVKLHVGETARIWEGQTKNLKAWEKAVLGHQAFMRSSHADCVQARVFLQEAIDIDPGFLGAIALLGITHYWDARYVPAVDRETSLRLAEACAERLQKVDPDLSQLQTLKSAIAFVRGNHAEAVRLGMASAARAPNDSRAHGFLGMFQMYDGQLQAALSSMQQSIRYCPIAEHYLYYYPAIIHMWLGNLDKALAYAIENCRIEGDEAYSAAYLAAIHVFRGETAKAQEVIQTLREAHPTFSIRNIRYSELYREPQRLERLCEALAKAGLPDQA